MSFWIFILYISFLLQAGHCLGVGFPFFNSAHVPFHPLSVGWLVSCHATTLFLLWYYSSLFVLLLLLSLRAVVPVIPNSHSIPSFSFHCPVFLLGQSIQHLGLPQPISFFGHPWHFSFLGHPWPISFFKHPWPFSFLVHLWLISFFPTSFILMGFY